MKNLTAWQWGFLLVSHCKHIIKFVVIIVISITTGDFEMTKIATYLTLGVSLALTLSFSSRSFAQWIGPPVLVQQPLVDVVELNRFAGKVNRGDQRTFSQNIQRNLFDRFLATLGNRCNGNLALLVSLTTLHIAIKLHDTKKIKL